MVPNSATAQWSSSPNAFINASQRLYSLWEDLDTFMDYKYHSEIEYNMIALEYNILLAKGDYKSLRQMKYLKYSFSLGVKPFVKYLRTYLCH